MSLPFNTPMPDFKTLVDALGQVPSGAGNVWEQMMGRSRPGYENGQPVTPWEDPRNEVQNPFLASVLGQNRAGFTNGQPNTPWEDPRNPSSNPLLAAILGQNRGGPAPAPLNPATGQPQMSLDSVLDIHRNTADRIQQKQQQQTQHPTDRGGLLPGQQASERPPVPEPPTGFADNAPDPRLGRWTRKLSAAERKAGMNDPKATAEIIIARNNVEPNSQAAQIFRETMQEEAVEWLKTQRTRREKAGVAGYPPVEDLYMYLNGYLSGLLEEGPIVETGPDRNPTRLPNETKKKDRGS